MKNVFYCAEELRMDASGEDVECISTEYFPTLREAKAKLKGIKYAQVTKWTYETDEENVVNDKTEKWENVWASPAYDWWFKVGQYQS